ncbi:myotubularin-related protein 14-like [Actinia tenebrosa]|uniref:Myotubularin-related protein 14-like n=1 Tax=Actinia tenebrosa TaxID=6105 RepID=A0A6P8IXV8_ACTTE|nr:myotubularin-related protein 14-like [Actinia tenebrosa]
MSSAEETSVVDLQELLQYFAKNTYKARGTEPKIELIQKKCHNLFAKDYKFSTISNEAGELCGHYPIKLVILESEAGQDQDKINESSNLRELFMKARFARCRSRFVIPVILFENKNICRSATLSSAAEIYGRSSYDFIFAGGESIPVEESKPEDAAEYYQGNDWALFDRIRGQDIKLLKELKVGYIFDLMMEKKKVKYGMNVTSSEKVDKANRYSDFCLCCVPYPGCEFFRDFKGKGYSADGLYFDWKQDYVDAQITIPEKIHIQLGIEWNRYKGWDLIMLTQNYLLLLLNFIKNGDSGTLIHCISGWDRTPLFVSLVRLSLWADKKAHKNLNAAEILYLTIAYDWFLFGHDLADRIQKGEEVFYFCFHFLKYIGSDVFSMNSLQQFKDQTIPSSVTRPRCDSGVQFDGAVLLEQWRGEGSNTSLNSCGSGSGCSEPRLSYFIGQEVPDVKQASLNSTHSTFTNGASTPNTHSSQSSLNSSPRSTLSFTNGCDQESDVIAQSTSPLPVPRRSRKTSMNSDHRSSSSSICGSWQLVSGTGSPKGTTTVGHGISTNSLCEAIEEVSPRQQRLDNVRTLFVKIYAKVIGYPIQEGNTFSNILDHVTGRIRESWSTAV